MKELKRKLMFIMLVLGISLGSISMVNGAQWKKEDFGLWELFTFNAANTVNPHDLDEFLGMFNSGGFEGRAALSKNLNNVMFAYYNTKNFDKFESDDVIIEKDNITRSGYRIKDEHLSSSHLGSSSSLVPLSWTTYPKELFERERLNRLAMLKALMDFIEKIDEE